MAGTPNVGESSRNGLENEAGLLADTWDPIKVSRPEPIAGPVTGERVDVRENGILSPRAVAARKRVARVPTRLIFAGTPMSGTVRPSSISDLSDVNLAVLLRVWCYAKEPVAGNVCVGGGTGDGTRRFHCRRTRTAKNRSRLAITISIPLVQTQLRRKSGDCSCFQTV